MLLGRPFPGTDSGRRFPETVSSSMFQHTVSPDEPSGEPTGGGDNVLRTRSCLTGVRVSVGISVVGRGERERGDCCPPERPNVGG